MKVKKRVKRSSKTISEQEKKAKLEVAAAASDVPPNDNLNVSVYTYYTEKTDAVLDASINLGDINAPPSRPTSGTKRERDADVQVLAELEAVSPDNVNIPQGKQKSDNIQVLSQAKPQEVAVDHSETIETLRNAQQDQVEGEMTQFVEPGVVIDTLDRTETAKTDSAEKETAKSETARTDIARNEAAKVEPAAKESPTENLAAAAATQASAINEAAAKDSAQKDQDTTEGQAQIAQSEETPTTATATSQAANASPETPQEVQLAATPEKSSPPPTRQPSTEEKTKSMIFVGMMLSTAGFLYFSRQ